jgi:glycosyltransferase involved in cell wall biosynthesis
MRIVLYDDRTGGHHAQHVNYLGRYLTDNGDFVRFVTPRANADLSDRLIDHPNFDIDLVEPDGYYRTLIQGFRARRACFRMATEWDADVVHLLDVNRTELPTLAASVWTGGRPWELFATLVAPYFLSSAGGFPTRVFHEASTRAMQTALRRGHVRTLFVLSEATRSRLLRQWTVPDDDIVAVPDPIEPFEDPKSMLEARRALNLPEDAELLLYFGSLRREKGPEVLLEAIPSVEADVTWVIAGEPATVGPEDVERCRRRLKDGSRLEARLEFLPDADVQDYFRAATAVILPYRSVYDGTSGILQHAAAAERPVIASNVSQIGVLVEEWGLGVTVPPEDPGALAAGIDAFLKNPDVATFDPIRAAEYVQAHHWRRWASQIRTEYRTGVEGE